MRTVKWNPFLSGVCTLLGGVILWTGAARGDVSSTNPAAIIVFPKVIVDVTGETPGTTVLTDTVIQISNTAANPVNVRCFYVNANGHCSGFPFTICDPFGPPAATLAACGATAFCVPGWQETDFAFRLTSKQPIDFSVSEGLANLPLADNPSPQGEFNSGSIPPAPEVPFRGELKCVQVGDDELPVDQNSLKGEATIETVGPDRPVDVRGYNAIGIQAIEGANNRDNTLVLGTEYNGCPNILVLDHFFDDAMEPANNGTVRTEITLVPCSEDFNFQAPQPVVVQYLVFNEFEQRFSTSRSVTCFQEIALSDIDTRLGTSDDRFSIFNVNVQGTLTGQTLARGVQTSDVTHGTGLLAITEVFVGNYSGAEEAHQRGARTQPDIILLPAAQPSGL